MLGCASWIGAALAASMAGTPTPVAATDVPDPLHDFGIEVGAHARNQRDESFGPVRYAGPLGSIAFAYAVEDDFNRHRIHLEVAAGRGRDLRNGTISWLDAILRYRYERRVSSGAPSLWIGGSVGGGPQVYRFGDDEGAADRFATLYDLAPRARIERILPTRRRFHAIDVALEIPVVAIAFRPRRPAGRAPETDVSLGELARLAVRSHRSGPYVASWHNAQSVRLELAWTMELGPWLEQRIAYRPSYQRLALYGELARWDHLFVYGLHFTL